MTKEKKDKHFIKKPVYPGGSKAFKDFISKNLKYPQDALKSKTQGTVFLKYDIDYKGNVTDAKVIKGIGNGCDEEAVRVIKLLKFEIPKGPRKLKVLFHKEAKINFKLPILKKQTKPNIQGQTQYVITPSKKKSKVKRKLNHTAIR